jgi:hypothetical protein
MMHENDQLFQEAQEFLIWLKQNQIRSLPKQIDNKVKRLYSQQQITWFNSLYQNNTYGTAKPIGIEEKNADLSDAGRACCGGRQTCMDQNYKNRQFYVLNNKFQDWYCSVNQFFLFVKQLTGEVYVNKDCEMTFEGTVGPIGNLSDPAAIINKLKEQLTHGQPFIQCKKYNCLCGLCAPKAKDLETFKKIIKKYQKD